VLLFSIRRNNNKNHGDTENKERHRDDYSKKYIGVAYHYAIFQVVSRLFFYDWLNNY